jgi:hypothetical protein
MGFAFGAKKSAIQHQIGAECSTFRARPPMCLGYSCLGYSPKRPVAAGATRSAARLVEVALSGDRHAATGFLMFGYSDVRWRPKRLAPSRSWEWS